MAVGYAVSIGATKVSFGAHYSDRGVYPDCRKEFVDAFQTAMRLGNNNDKLRVEAPFVEMTKTDVVKLGSERSCSVDVVLLQGAGRAVRDVQ